MFSYYCHISWLQTKPTNMSTWHTYVIVYLLKASEQRFFLNGYESYEAHSIEIKRNKKFVYAISKLLNTYNYNSRFPEVTKALIISCTWISISFLISETVHKTVITRNLTFNPNDKL